MNSAKQIFTDISKEMEGRCLSDTFEVYGHMYEMKLLNGEESNWRNANIIMETKLAALSSIKLPTLAIGIRSMDGASVEEAFKDSWKKIEEDERAKLESNNPFAKKYFLAEHFMQLLSQWGDKALDELWEKWGELSERSEKARNNLKKQSGGSSEETKKENSTELSPSGDQ